MHIIFNSLKGLAAPVHSNLTGLPYIFCNEQCQEHTLQQLVNIRKESKNRLHIGFSVWFNFDTICASRPSYAIILDNSPEVSGYIYPLLHSLIKVATSKEEFSALFKQEILNNEYLSTFYGYLEPLLEQAQKTPHGFLFNKENFEYLKKMAQEGRLFFGQVDLLNEKDIKLLKQWIDDNELELATLYISNISEWILQSHFSVWGQAKANITSLLQSETALIDAFYPTPKKGGSGPPQRVTKAQLPDYTVKKEKRTPGIFSVPPTKSKSELYCLGILDYDEIMPELEVRPKGFS